MRICVYCAAGEHVDNKYKEAMIELGHRMAEEGHMLVFGGGGCGLMGAVCKGITEKGGVAIGVVPEFMNGFEPISKYASNITVPDMASRKVIMEKNADIFVIAPGGIGTFDEFFQCLTLKELGQHDQPILVYNCEGFYDDLIAYMKKCTEGKFIREKVSGMYEVCNDLDELFAQIRSYKK